MVHAINIVKTKTIKYHYHEHDHDHNHDDQVFVTIGTAICLVAALANDQHFPVAKLTVREAKVTIRDSEC